LFNDNESPLRLGMRCVKRPILLMAIFLASLLLASFTTAMEAKGATGKEGLKTFAHTNRLIRSADPYLLLHAHNPVDWYPWGPEALEKARREDKPIFLSIGYSTCYWCHVAERELYSDPAIAALMNKWFVNIKVDREERPDLDRVYMLAREILTGNGGWPNNVFLTPGLRPFFAGSYFPPEARPGRPGFPDILKGLHRAWTRDRARVEEVADEVYSLLQKPSPRAPVSSEGQPPQAQKWPDQALREASLSFDEANGGFSEGRVKFPKSPLLSMLLEAYRAGHDKNAMKMATETLLAMAEGGVMDQVGWGFHRYATEPTWSIPHFEKMLYDNAQLLDLYARAYEITKRPVFRQVALETALFLKREMRAPKGGFYSALDAETARVEGATYTWTRKEIEKVLGKKDAALFLDLYTITPMPEFEGHGGKTRGGVLRLRPSKARTLAKENKLAAAIKDLGPLREKLLRARLKRAQPARDEKIVTADNALAVMGFTGAGRALHEEELTDIALETGEWLFAKAVDEKTGEVRHQFFRGRAGGPGFLSDYALLGEAFLGLYRETGKAAWLRRARLVARSMQRRFTLADGALSTTWERKGLPSFSPIDGDAEKPSGRSAAIGLLLGLSAETGTPEFSLAALRALRPLGAHIEASPLAWPGLLERLERPGLRAALETAIKKEAKTEYNKKATDSAAHVKADARWYASARGPELVVSVNIEPGYHLNANPASAPYLVPTELIINGRPGARITYPPPVSFRPEFSKESIHVYDGSVTIRAHLPGGGSSFPETVDLRVQACNEALCLAPAVMKLGVEKTNQQSGRARRR